MSINIILIHPPIAKCSEPPAGIAKLSACLNENCISHEVIDANLEGIFFLLTQVSNKNAATDRWTARACKKIEANLSALRDMTTYQNLSRYQRAVIDINHLLKVVKIN